MRFLLKQLFLLCVFIIALPGCGSSETPAAALPTASQISTFTERAGIRLPPSAQPVGWRQERGIDEALWLQVKMPAQDLQKFLENSPFRDGTLVARDLYQLSQFKELMPKTPTRYRAGQRPLPNGQVLNMVVDESDASNAVVYLMWHRT